MNKKGYILCLLAFAFCREKYNFCKTKKHFFSPMDKSLRGREKSTDWEMFVVTFIFPQLFSKKKWITEHSRRRGCVSNSALWVLPSCLFFPGTRQAKACIFTRVSLGWEGLISWGRYVCTNRSYVSVSEAHPLLALSRSLGSSWRPPSVI